MDTKTLAALRAENLLRSAAAGIAAGRSVLEMNIGAGLPRRKKRRKVKATKKKAAKRQTRMS